MKRWAFNILAGLSLLLGLATAGLWMRSYWYQDGAARVRQNGWIQGEDTNADPHFVWRYTAYFSMQGRLGWINGSSQIEGAGAPIFAFDMWKSPQSSVGWHFDYPWASIARLPSPTLRNGFGFCFEHEHTENRLTMAEDRGNPPRKPGMDWVTLDTRWASVPYWVIALLTGIMPAKWLFVSIRGRKLPGHCGRCGYNLTGNISGVCPECGKVIESKTK